MLSVVFDVTIVLVLEYSIHVGQMNLTEKCWVLITPVNHSPIFPFLQAFLFFETVVLKLNQLILLQ